LAIPSRRTLLGAVLVLGAIWTLPVHPGRLAGAPATTGTIVSPAFAISAQPGVVKLTGHTSSRRHEALLRQAVERHFPNRQYVLEFRPFGPAPDWWTRATTELVGAIASTRAPQARLDEHELSVRALARQPTASTNDVLAFAASLPVPLETDIRILDTGPAVDARVLCARYFESFRNGPIHFLESQTRMRPSATPELERVVAVSTACRESVISITGHTDASGNEAWNRQLSLERAGVVRDWLVARGVDSKRIRLTGAGSSEPVASNETRYGRSQNRRIDIGFSYEE
jgi:outer membrane protein OmpA-like peptidoglycan-associated protein